MNSLYVVIFLAYILASAFAQYWPGYAGLPYPAAYPYAAGYPYTAGLYSGRYLPSGFGYTAAWAWK